MKYLLALLFLVLIISCDRNDEEFIYSYKITRASVYFPNKIKDSIIYYYDNIDRLLKIAHCDSDNSCRESFPLYEDNRILLNGNQYILNTEHRIDSLIYDSDNIVCYTYSNGYIVHEVLNSNNSIKEEHYYQYNDGILLKDSIINENQYITVYNHICTDTLIPNFMINYTGLKEYPLKSKYLIKESIALEANIKTIHSYDISKNKLTDNIKTIDTYYRDTTDVEITKYYYEEK